MTTYTADDISTLEGLEAIRQRPGMYIGNNGLEGLHHILKEVFSNSLDEALAGYGNTIRVVINQNSAVEVADDGRDIPVDWKADANMSTLTRVMTVLHTGGKFSDNVYASSGGMNGVGTKAVCAMSRLVQVEVRRGGLIFRQSFRDGGRYDRGVLIYNPGQDKAIGEITAGTVIHQADGLITAVTQAGRPLKIRPDKKLGSGRQLPSCRNRNGLTPKTWSGKVSCPGITKC